ncbi:coronatine-insensitive protein homolog 1b-like isoform X2 [Miscanthus floridulus]|uniref:coronatine-insensitive protein homolog 1b-like isoform X2 n=1 Tax=Miscanthus floridulus TaxID=154761 RepID=UPI00345B2098
MYGLIPDDWGAYVRPWVTELAAPLECLKALHLRRMVVTDNDLAELVRAKGHMLQELKLDKCTGFSTDGLRLVAHSCRYVKMQCPDCGSVPDEPALCLLCGKLCSPSWKPCMLQDW